MKNWNSFWRRLQERKNSSGNYSQLRTEMNTNARFLTNSINGMHIPKYKFPYNENISGWAWSNQRHTSVCCPFCFVGQIIITAGKIEGFMNFSECINFSCSQKMKSNMKPVLADEKIFDLFGMLDELDKMMLIRYWSEFIGQCYYRLKVNERSVEIVKQFVANHPGTRDMQYHMMLRDA